jgi:hypothetical protein
MSSWWHLAQHLSWRTTPSWLSATTYSIYLQLTSVLEAVSPSATWRLPTPWDRDPFIMASSLMRPWIYQFVKKYFEFPLRLSSISFPYESKRIPLTPSDVHRHSSQQLTRRHAAREHIKSKASYFPPCMRSFQQADSILLHDVPVTTHSLLSYTTWNTRAPLDPVQLR